MEVDNSWSRWGKVLLLWIVSAAVGGGVAYFFVVGLAMLLGSADGLPFWIGVPVSVALGGTVAGLEQRRLFSTWTEMSPAWVVWTAIGWAFGVSALVVLTVALTETTRTMSNGDAIMTFVLVAALVGVLSSLGQWWLLRGKVSRVNWWLLASAVGWILAWVTALGMAWVIQELPALPTTMQDVGLALLLGGLAGGMLGLEQGVALIGLFAQMEWDARRKARDEVFSA